MQIEANCRGNVKKIEMVSCLKYSIKNTTVKSDIITTFVTLC